MPLDQLTDEELNRMYPDDAKRIAASEMPFLEHLEVLRWHLIRAIAVIGALTIGAFSFGQWIFQHIIFAPAKPSFWTYRQLCALGEWTGASGLCVQSLNFQIQSTTLTGQFMMYISACFVMGLVLGFPYLVWELWRFIKPGLYLRELQATRGMVFWISTLFLLGVLFGYFVVVPLSVNFLATFQIDPSIKNDINIVSYVSTLTTLVLACAILFQLPVLVYFLAQMRVITASFMRTYRRHAIVVILILAAIVTPSPDLFSQVLIALPLLFLYEVSIGISTRVERRIALAEAASQGVSQDTGGR